MTRGNPYTKPAKTRTRSDGYGFSQVQIRVGLKLPGGYPTCSKSAFKLFVDKKLRKSAAPPPGTVRTKEGTKEGIKEERYHDLSLKMVTGTHQIGFATPSY
jgi:hypothetical protein